MSLEYLIKSKQLERKSILNDKTLTNGKVLDLYSPSKMFDNVNQDFLKQKVAKVLTEGEIVYSRACDDYSIVKSGYRLISNDSEVTSVGDQGGEAGFYGSFIIGERGIPPSFLKQAVNISTSISKIVTDKYNEGVEYFKKLLSNNKNVNNPLINPIPSSNEDNYINYSADSGVDIHVKAGAKVVCAADGYLLYSEYGHTTWDKYPDTPYSILIELKEPIDYDGRTFKYLYYTHMKTLEYKKADNGKRGQLIKAGTLLGTSGTGNSVDHLHFGLIANRSQTNPSDWLSPNELQALIFYKK